MTPADALAALADALTRAGVPVWSPPASHAVLDELERELAPLLLPEAVADFWRRVDVSTLRAQPFPSFSSPEFALSGWRAARDEFPALQPLALLTVAYDSQLCLSVELGDADRHGGALYQWDLVDGPFERRGETFPQLLLATAAAIDGGHYDRHDGPTGPWLQLRPPAREPALSGEAIGRDVLAWPGHWQRSSGLHPEDLVLHGATHTVAEVLGVDREMRATIDGSVVALAGGLGIDVRVDDGTGTLDVHCPAPTTLLGPVLGRRYEFDVVVPEGGGYAVAEAVRRVP